MENNNKDCTRDDANTKHPINDITEALDNLENTIYTSNIKKLQSFAKAFEKAEQDIKNAEIADPRRNGVLIPAINELRYCSYHIVKALSSKNASDQKEELSRAERHCVRATFDALELGLTTLIEQIADFTDYYFKKKVRIGEVIDKFSEKMASVHEAKDLLGINYKDKETHFQSVSDSLIKLKSFYRELDASREQLILKSYADRRAWLIPACIAFFAGITATTGIFKFYVPQQNNLSLQEINSPKLQTSSCQVDDSVEVIEAELTPKAEIKN